MSPTPPVSCDSAQYTLSVNGRVGNPTDEATASAALVHLLALGYAFPAVALLRRADPSAAWEPTELPLERLPRLHYVNRLIRYTGARSG